MPFASLEHGPTKCKHFGDKAMRKAIQNGPTKCKHVAEEASAQPARFKNSVTPAPDGLELPPNVLDIDMAQDAHPEQLS